MGRKRTTKQKLPSNDNATAVDKKQPRQERNGGSSTNQEFERQIAAMKAVSEMEVEHLITEVLLLKSYLNEEQLQTPILQFLKESLPNVSVVTEDGHFDLRWKDDDGNLATYNTVSRDIHDPLLQQMCMAYPGCSDVRQPFSGFQFPATDMKNIVGVDDMQTGTYLSQESLNTMMLGMPEGFQTPGAQSQRLSVGMTPKTRRLPKHGEMLLSVHGSPLGVYKEDNMEAICEAEED
ncbi:hypothetical protein SOVF_138280 [Spinacia oleracea]|uniref:Uncharacterized protein n=1 Tax=Spinacia oleracea TaxID=3562 RepID=A0A9R0HR21_SPIOL|nr:uncharacterized protein LOC110775119 [Spinacia oleracea]KNA11103.1 hypothetical protein SOVF_138280 [Spinacia oleracea]